MCVFPKGAWNGEGGRTCYSQKQFYFLETLHVKPFRNMYIFKKHYFKTLTSLVKPFRPTYTY